MDARCCRLHSTSLVLYRQLAPVRMTFPSSVMQPVMLEGCGSSTSRREAIGAICVSLAAITRESFHVHKA